MSTARASATAERPLLELRGVAKRFGGVIALSDVAFDLRRGEIHAIVGENGAGKSTLIRILAGVHAADAGAIRIDGRPVAIRSVADADRLGIRAIHQELSLVPHLSVAENIYLGREHARWGFLRRGPMFRAARELVERLELPEIRDVRARVASLSIAEKQLVEIARALSADARILILDEPTSALSEAEAEALFATLRRLRAQGTGIVYISHRLEEVSRLADRITVLRDGRAVGTRRADEVDQREIVRMMVGRELEEYFRRPAHRPGGVALEVRGLRAAGVHGVDLEVRAGEIVGLAGLVGSGRTELARALFGVSPIRAGSVRVVGKSVRLSSPADALAAGIVVVPEDRKAEGLVMPQSAAFNIALPWTRLWNPHIAPDRKKRAEIVERAVKAFAIRLADTEQPVGTLSGGNQQKVLVSRWMERRPKVLVLDEPTRGIDVGARREMFSIVSALVEDGMAVVLISSDLSEVLNMSHRVVLYRDGRPLREVPAEELTLEDLVAELTGARRA